VGVDHPLADGGEAHRGGHQGADQLHLPQQGVVRRCTARAPARAGRPRRPACAGGRGDAPPSPPWTPLRHARPHGPRPISRHG
jgi:hypothetical protein